MTNLYRPPTTSSNLASSTAPSRTLFAALALAGLTVVAAWCTKGTPYRTVIGFAGSAVVTLPFVDATDRRPLIWSFVGGVVLSVVWCVAYTSGTTAPPTNYIASAVYEAKLNLMLTYGLPLGGCLGILSGMGFRIYAKSNGV